MTTDQMLEKEIAEDGYSPEEERVHQALLQAGLIKEIKPRHRQSKLDRPLIPIQGKPLSETIIEERR